MFKEILKIIPTIDNSDLNKMERSLTQRFGKVAKKFGKGLLGAIKSGGALGLAIGMVDKFLNPLKEVQESIERTLKIGDDLVTFAAQFNTSAGKLAKLEAFAGATGLDRDSLFTVLNKFQTAIAEARLDPNLQTPVRQFANRDDTADAFFEFVQGLQKMGGTDRALVTKRLFGDREGIKLSDFLQSDFADLNKRFFSGFSSDELTKAAEKTGGLSDLNDALTAQRNLKDIIDKSKLVNESMIRANDERLKQELQRENERIKSYQSLSNISEASTKIMTLVERGVVLLSDMVIKVTGLTELIKKMAPSRLLRGIFGGD